MRPLLCLVPSLWCDVFLARPLCCRTCAFVVGTAPGPMPASYMARGAARPAVPQGGYGAVQGGPPRYNSVASMPSCANPASLSVALPCPPRQTQECHCAQCVFGLFCWRTRSAKSGGNGEGGVEPCIPLEFLRTVPTSVPPVCERWQRFDHLAVCARTFVCTGLLQAPWGATRSQWHRLPQLGCGLWCQE